MNKGRFVRHYLEMVAAMLVGMAVLGPLVDLVFGPLDRPEVAALVMATEMSVAMALLMRIRRHAWIGILEMCAAMYVPFVVLFIPFWLGAIGGTALIWAGHVLMLPAMLVVMLWRREHTHVAA